MKHKTIVKKFKHKGLNLKSINKTTVIRFNRLIGYDFIVSSKSLFLYTISKARQQILDSPEMVTQICVLSLVKRTSNKG